MAQNLIIFKKWLKNVRTNIFAHRDTKTDGGLALSLLPPCADPQYRLKYLQLFHNMDCTIRKYTFDHRIKNYRIILYF